jgi:hypothetical protein
MFTMGCDVWDAVVMRPRRDKQIIIPIHWFEPLETVYK